MKDFLFKHNFSVALVKTISWRAIASVDTFVLAFFFSGQALHASGIAASEVFTKMTMYYLYENLWLRFSGRQHSHKQTLIKTLGWRGLATIDTIIISTLVLGNPTIALKIGLAEIFTKMILYFCHERIWNFLLIKFDYTSHGPNYNLHKGTN